MNQLTQEQIKTLEDAFASYPEDFLTTSKYASMKGIQEQLEELNGEPGDIFFHELERKFQIIKENKLIRIVQWKE